MFINPQYNSKQLINKICQMMGLKKQNWSHFGLFECTE